MKAEAWVFGITALFVAVVAPAYWFLRRTRPLAPPPWS